MASKLTLDGGVALVTGAASDIGRETALAFAEAGAKGVVFADINYQQAGEAAEQSRKYATHAEYRALAIKCDLTNTESVQNTVAEAVEQFGRIDYAVNSAGIDLEGYTSFTPTVDLEVFSKISDINITGAMRFIRATTEAMAKQTPLMFPGTLRHGPRSLGRGSIVLLGSLSSLIGAPGICSYTTSKHAVIAVDSLALKSEIRVNAVCPGWVDTPMVQNITSVNPALGYAIQNLTPLKRAAKVDEVADYIVFLSSPSASFINGTSLAIDAGFTLPAPPPRPSHY